MFSKTKYLVIMTIIIIAYLTSVIEGFILITERDAVESLLEQIKTSRHGDKKGGTNFEKYLDKYEPSEFIRELIDRLLSEDNEYKHKERPISRNLFRIHKKKRNEIHNIEENLKDILNNN